MKIKCCLYLIPVLLFAQRLSAQDTLGYFPLKDHGEAFVILSKENNLVADFGGAAHKLMSYERNVYQVDFEDINHDGFMDINFSFYNPSGYLVHRIFIFDIAIKQYTELVVPSKNWINVQSLYNGSLETFDSDGQWSEYSFDKQGKIYLSARKHAFIHPSLEMNLQLREEFDVTGFIQRAAFVEDYVVAKSVVQSVKVNQLELYTNPSFFSTSLGFLALDNTFQIVSCQGNDWLKVKHIDAGGKERIGWIAASEMLIDKLELNAAVETTEQGVELELFNPHYDNDRLFLFAATLANNGHKTYGYSDNARLFILLEDPHNRRALYSLYALDAANLEPKSAERTLQRDASTTAYKPDIVLDDNFVEWDADRSNYVIYREMDQAQKISYTRFIPKNIPVGKYKMYAVLYDYSDSAFTPLVSNPQDIEYPLPMSLLKSDEEYQGRLDF